MSRTVKIGGALVFGVFVLALLTLRLVGYEPQYLYPSGEEFARNNRIARPGLWLTGEVVREVITDWDFVNHLDDPERRDTVMLETRTWYGIPHSVTIGIVGRGGKLYIHARSGSRRMQTPFPNDKYWTQNVSRDPRVRLKIEDEIYEATVALMTDRDEVAAVMGREPITVEPAPTARSASPPSCTTGACSSGTFRTTRRIRRGWRSEGDAIDALSWSWPWTTGETHDRGIREDHGRTQGRARVP